MDTISTTSPTSAPLSLMASGQASAAAMMRSSQSWAAGYKMLGDIMAETAKGHFDQTALVWQEMGRIKTVKEAVELQTGYLRNTTEHSVAGAKKLVEATSQLTHEAMSRMVERMATLTPTSEPTS